MIAISEGPTIAPSRREAASEPCLADPRFETCMVRGSLPRHELERTATMHLPAQLLAPGARRRHAHEDLVHGGCAGGLVEWSSSAKRRMVDRDAEELAVVIEAVRAEVPAESEL